MRTPRHFDTIVERALFSEEYGLGLDPDSYAGQRAEEAVRMDETLAALSIAEYHTDREQSERHDRDDEYRDYLLDVWGAIDDGLDEAFQRVAIETIEDVEIGGHSVDLRHRRRLDCPVCDEEDVEAYHLGTTQDVRVVGWVCGHCGSELIEDANGTIVADDTPIEGGDE